MASLGQALREEREARNISIEEIASSTKIVRRYLEALEDDRMDVMPGGFFIKGIIRAYAKAVGLDPEEVLGRYKAAGLLGEPERKRNIFQRAAPEPAPPLPPPPAPAPPVEPVPTPAPPASPAPPPPPSPAAPPDTLPAAPAETPAGPSGPAPVLAFEPAPKPRLSPAARKLIFGWIWRSAAVLLVVAVLVVLWSSRRPRPPQAKPAAVATETVVAGGALPPSQPAVQPEPPPVVEEAWAGVTIELTFRAETWIRVYTDGALKIDGLFPAGTSARAHADERLVISTGNAGGFTFLLNGQPARPLGRAGQILTDVLITPGNYKELLEARPPGPPAG